MIFLFSLRHLNQLTRAVIPLSRDTRYIPGELVSLLSAAPYRRIPITASNFDAQFPPQREAPELRRCESKRGFHFAESIQAKQTL
ncbi:hypothetical protein TNCV_533061 [Trichonephila clavipes]|nr:hypothetical protein TNCV_533061 [Trichonephila clavipes]